MLFHLMAEIRQTDVSDFCKIAPIFGHPSCCSQQNILRMILFSAHDLSMTNKKALDSISASGAAVREQDPGITVWRTKADHATVRYPVFHPDYTVGTGIPPVQSSFRRSRGLYRR